MNWIIQFHFIRTVNFNGTVDPLLNTIVEEVISVLMMESHCLRIENSLIFRSKRDEQKVEQKIFFMF